MVRSRLTKGHRLGIQRRKHRRCHALLILLIAKIGVEAAAVAVGIAMPLVIIPLSIFYLRRDPKGLCLAPHGLPIDSNPTRYPINA